MMRSSTQVSPRHKTTCLNALLFMLIHSCQLKGVESALGDLLWSEEFNQAADNGASYSLPDSSIWSYDLGGGGWGNGELQTYTDHPDNVRVEDGNLKIAVQEDADVDFTSARVHTQGNFLFQYGRLEARIKVPNVANGLWPAFWTMGYDFGLTAAWPDAGEVDIMEIGQGLAIADGVVNRRVVSAAHWEHEGTYATYADWYTASYNLWEDYQIYRLEWTPTRLATFVNQELIWVMDIDSDSCADCEEFHKLHFILLNIAVGGGFTSGGLSSGGSSGTSSAGCGGSSSSSGSSSGAGCGGLLTAEQISAPLPATMDVDWIRLYDNGYTTVSSENATPNPTPAPTPATTPENVTPNPTPAPTPATTPENATPNPTPAPTPGATPMPTPGPTPSPTPQPTPMPTPGPTPSPTPQPTPSPTPNPTPEPTTLPPTSMDRGGNGAPVETNPVPPPTPPPTPLPTPPPSLAPFKGLVYTLPPTLSPVFTSDDSPVLPPVSDRNSDPTGGSGGSSGGKGGKKSKKGKSSGNSVDNRASSSTGKGGKGKSSGNADNRSSSTSTTSTGKGGKGSSSSNARVSSSQALVNEELEYDQPTSGIVTGKQWWVAFVICVATTTTTNSLVHFFL